MADFQCCSSYTECNELVTIGYLKNFIGDLLQDSSGNTIIISTSSADTYCPTYNEIKALLPAHVNGANGPLDDVDGIVLNGTGNSTVKQQELSIVYTRFVSFTITATTAQKTCDCSGDASKICACGGNSNFTYTNTYKRYTKSMGSNCTTSTTSSNVTDTQDSRVTFTTATFGTVSGHGMSVTKNGTHHSSERCTTVTGHVMFRNSEKTNTATVCQNPLTGSYQFWYYDYANVNKRTECTGGPSFGCHGGSYSAKALYDIQRWTIDHWVDCCGTPYDNDYRERSGSRTITDRDKVAHTYSNAFPNIQSTGGSNRDSISWSSEGYGDGCSWTQTCTPPPTDCESYVEYGEGTGSASASCSGETVTVTSTNIPYTKHIRHLDEDNNCIEEVSTGYTTGSVRVTVACNDGAARTISGVATNTTTEGITYSIRYTITQPAGPCCPAYCNCELLTVSTTEMAWDANETDVRTRTMTAAACIKNITIEGLSHFSASTSSNTLSIKPRTTNTGQTSIVETLKIKYNAESSDKTESCVKSIVLTHNTAELPPCSCTHLTFTLDN